MLWRKAPSSARGFGAPWRLWRSGRWAWRSGRWAWRSGLPQLLRGLPASS
ncbi:MAG: hypothetical protein LBO20_03345 [Bifidobacteriaceae bacterium]|nr:hypothetical protein [Bifidobacteriaceae bacterium]